MRKHFLWISIAASLAACGGGGGGGGSGGSSQPVIQFEVDYDLGANTPTNRSMTVRPVAGAPGFGSNAIARAELSTNNEPPTVLTATNAVDATGRAQYVFTVPQYPYHYEVAIHTCGPSVPMKITLTDTTGFSFTKYDTFCPGQAFVAGGFSDYGGRTARYTGASALPANARFALFGSDAYNASYAYDAITSLDHSFSAKEGDFLITTFGYASTSGVPAGSKVTARIDAEGGAFAESTIAANPLDWQAANASLVCCRPVAAAASAQAARKVQLVAYGARYNVPNPPPVEFDYRLRVVDPTSGQVLADLAGAAADIRAWSYEVKAGDQVSLQATPKAAGSTVVLTIRNTTDSPNAGQVLGEARSNLPGVNAGLNVFCCAR